MYYFAYGSNLSKEQMHDRCPDSEYVCVGRLAQHKLEFSKYSGRWSGGVARPDTSVKRVSPSLEDVFVALIQEGGGAVEG